MKMLTKIIYKNFRSNLKNYILFFLSNIVAIMDLFVFRGLKEIVLQIVKDTETAFLFRIDFTMALGMISVITIMLMAYAMIYYLKSRIRDYLLKFPLKKEENSMKETNIIYDSVSNTWSIIVKVVNKSLLQIEYPELTGYKTKEDAEIAYHKAMHQFAMDMENIKSITGVKYTLSSYIEHWYVDIFKQYTTSPSYLQTTDWAIQRVILPSIEEDHLLINLTPEYINDILQRCAKLPYRTAGIVSRKVLCTILKTAEAEELLDIKFSFESIITFPKIPPKYIAYEKEDICKLLEIAKKSDAIYLEILLCLFAGLRIGEVRGLNYDHVDFQNNTITIMQQIPNESYIEIKTENGIERRVNENCIKPPKSGASYRTLKVPDIIMEELQRRKEFNAYYFQTHPEAVQYWNPFANPFPCCLIISTFIQDAI